MNAKQRAEAKRGPGRPKDKYTPEVIADLVKKFIEYIDINDNPIIKEFCYLNDILVDALYDNEEFSHLLKKSMYKKEAFLEAGGLTNQINTGMAIFTLKQPAHGWSDKQQIEHGGKIDGDHKFDISLLSDEQLRQLAELKRATQTDAPKQ